MKVLLLGEFSGFYKYLKEGLEKNNVIVDWYAGGDGFKQIQGMDGDIAAHTGIKLIDKILYPIYLVCRLGRYDVIQLIHPLIFSSHINALMVKMLKRKCKILCLSAVGTDYTFFQYWKKEDKKYPYFALDECDDYDAFYARKRFVKNDIAVINMCDAIIPGSYEYVLAYEKHPKALPQIRFLINTEDVEYQENEVADKVVFFHGLNRENFKGTKYIRAAMEKLKEKYPEEVEIIIDGRMPFDQYMKVMRRANVILDQCKSYSPGINALLAMAQGKVVLSGAENLSIDEVEPKDYPVRNINPDVDQIFSVLEHILLYKEQIPIWGKESRKFVEKYYNYIKNAELYKSAWETLISKKKEKGKING